MNTAKQQHTRIFRRSKRMRVQILSFDVLTWLAVDTRVAESVEHAEHGLINADVDHGDAMD
jgi:hypothetical protein